MWFMNLFWHKIIFYSSSSQRCLMKKGDFIHCTNSQENACARASFLINSQAWGLQLFKKETLAHLFFCEFCEISKNKLFIKLLCMTASDFICGLFFIFPLSKIFTTKKGASCEKSRLVENRLKETGFQQQKDIYIIEIYKEIIWRNIS